MSQQTSATFDAPHFVSLVLNSKKALQHGEQLCSKAHDLAFETSQAAIELMALDAKARWTSQGILEQLKLAGGIGSSIEAQRSRLEDQAKQWDNARSFHSGNLDTILEALGAQPVPASFYESPTSSSVFGSQFPDPDGEDKQPGRSTEDRSRWKTLRDFVDERAIEDASETVDNERVALDDILSTTEDFASVLTERVTSLKESLPPCPLLPSLSQIFDDQERLSTSMAGHLESLSSHYEQMSMVLQDKESGVEFSEEDLLDINRDMDELPSIIGDLEDDLIKIRRNFDVIAGAKSESRGRLSDLRITLGKLDELSEIMQDMLDQQQGVEHEYETHLASLQSHLTSLEHLYMTYTNYQHSYNNLLVELDRRRRYRDSTRELLANMLKELDIRRQDEIHARQLFVDNHRAQLPDDLCPCIDDVPLRYTIDVIDGDTQEELPDIDEDLLEDAVKRIDLAKAGSESL
ncbi:hypothetical protein SCHPADRAFT_822029 [Schizopora paradoxa]|uniref:Autophagy-related protein 17 n=1 Tax=Schizopora paradoxa TaxID=27342 RepID=A0A0H2RYH3_9AGAM|nr:hypothetical protein SCHPADRAFT_822029 [Schizopora paradoxa]